MRIAFFLIVIALSVLLHLFLPWYAPALAALVVALLLPLSAGRAAALGCLAVALLWGGYATWLHWANEGLLGNRIGLLFGGIDGWMVVVVTTALGGLLGWLGALTGSQLRLALNPGWRPR